MLRNRRTWLSIALISVLLMAGPQVIAQGFIDNFNRPDQDGPPEGWTAFRGEWTIADGALVGESSNFDNNTLREAWIWAGQPPVEVPSDLELSFDMSFLTDSNVGDGNGRHAGIMFCSSRPTHRWDREGGINGYCLDWIDRVRDRGVRLVRIDGGNQEVLRNAGRKLPGPPLHWRVVLDASTIRVWGDDELIMEVDDGRHRGGHFGFWVWSNGTRVAYDNVMTGNAALLPLGEQRTVRLQPGVDGEDTAAFYFTAHREAGAPGNTIVFSLDGQEGDENALLMAWGRVPTPRDYDLAANLRGQADQRLVIPFARDEVAYILPQALSDGDGGNGFNTVTLSAELPDIYLQELSVDSALRPLLGDSPNRVTTSVFGGGFTQETNFIFTAEGGQRLPVVESRFVSSSHVLLTMDVAARSFLGSYALQASNGAARGALLPGAFRVFEDGAPGLLDVRLIAAGRVRPYRPRPLQVHYSNTGSGALAPRLLRIKPPAGVMLRFEGEPDFLQEGAHLDILTVNPVGYPGLLPAGASGGKTLIFMVSSPGQEELEFTVEMFSPLPGDLLCLEQGPNCPEATLTRPGSVPVAAWSELNNVLGSTLAECIERLGAISLRLALRGRDPASVQEALRLAVQTAWTQVDPSHPSAAVSGVLRDSGGEPLDGVRVAVVRGAERVCGETSSTGFFAIEGLQGGAAAYQLEVEGFNVDAEIAVSAGLEVSFGNVVAGEETPDPFPGCPAPGDSFLLEMELPSDRLALEGTRRVEVIIPEDPNYKSGPGGQSQGQLDPDGPGPEPEQTVEIILEPQHRIDDGATMFYEVTFQNAEGADPAQSVNVLDELPAELDPSTVRFLGVGVDYQFYCTDTTSGTFTIGNQSSCGLNYYNQNDYSTAGNFLFQLDLNPDIYVNVDFTRDGNELKWEFTSLTSTLQPIECEPNMDEEGFLVGHIPETPEGEAFVQFAVDLAPGSRAPGTLIRNKARVEFLDLKPMGGGGGAGNLQPWFLDTDYANHLIGRESDWPQGCSGGVDEDLDGLVDCDDPDCAADVNCLDPAEVIFRRGDANSDGNVDISDPSRIFNYLFMGGQAPACFDAADGNDDGGIDLSDGVFLLWFLFQGAAAPPQPGPFTCGVDPTADGPEPLGCDMTACE